MTISIRPENWNLKENLTINSLRVEKFFNSLRSVAQSRIKMLYRKMRDAKDPSVYLDEIKKVILDEQDRKLREKRGEEID